MNRIIVVASVDGHIVRRSFPDARSAFPLFDGIVQRLYYRWVVIRDRSTGESWRQVAARRKQGK